MRKRTGEEKRQRGREKVGRGGQRSDNWHPHIDTSSDAITTTVSRPRQLTATPKARPLATYMYSSPRYRCLQCRPLTMRGSLSLSRRLEE